MICGQCFERCAQKTIDAGIGGYEYWGFIGNDRNNIVVSRCCEAPVYDTLADAVDASGLGVLDALATLGYASNAVINVASFMIDMEDSCVSNGQIVEAIDDLITEAHGRS